MHGLKKIKPSYLGLIGLLALIALGAQFVASNYILGIAVFIGALAISSTGMVLMFGYAHQLVLGQAAFCLIGAYGSGLLTTKAGWDPLLALVASASISVVAAYLIGRPILRLRGFVLAMASLAVQLILISAATEALSVTGGTMGLTGIPSFAVFGWRFDTPASMVWLVWLTVAAAIVIADNIASSRLGLGLRAIASSEAGAASLGIDIPKLKVEMFVVSAALASVAGSLTAHYLRLVEPQIFNLQYGFTMLTAVIIGGLISPWGGVIGAVIISLLKEFLKELGAPLVELLIMGAVTVIALLLMPGGVVGIIKQLLRKRRDAENHTSLSEVSSTPHLHVSSAPVFDGPLLEAMEVSIAFGSLKAVDQVSLSVARGSITALIGPNGAGKTTTFNLICGYLPCQGGTVAFNGRRVERNRVDQIALAGLGRTFQLLQLFSGMSVLENVMVGRHRYGRASLISVLCGTPKVRTQERDARSKALSYLDFVGLRHLATSLPEELPFGQQRQVELARALATEPTLLVMDEPASGLNDVETEELAKLIVKIRAAGITVLLVEHDMRLVMGLADHIVVMDRGKKIEEGAPAKIRSSDAVIRAYLAGSDA